MHRLTTAAKNNAEAFLKWRENENQIIYDLKIICQEMY